jgi:germination protein M
MDNKKIILIGLIIILGLTAFGCRGKVGFKKLFSKEDDLEIIRSDEHEIEITEEDGMRKTVLYFQNKEGFLVPLMRKIPWEEGIAKVTLKNMVDNPELRETLQHTGLLPVIPAGTEIKGMSINEETGLCKVDFSKDVLDYDSEKEEENFIKGVVYTLTEFPAVKEVQVLVDGNVVPALKYGSTIDKPLTRENINLIGNLEEGRSKVLVYYKGNEESDFEYFVPVTIPTLAPMANVYTALDLLFNGPPTESGLSSDIPTGVTLHGVEIKDGTAFVDVSFIQDVAMEEEATFNGMIKNIGLTLSQFEEVESVELLIDGKALEETGLDFYINATIPAFANEY